MSLETFEYFRRVALNDLSLEDTWRVMSLETFTRSGGEGSRKTLGEHLEERVSRDTLKILRRR